jgi:hypothetical protein
VRAPVVLRHHNVQSTPTAALDADPKFSARLTGASMRAFEMGLAVAAIATALLLGLGR